MPSINNNIPFVPENTIDPAAGLNESINTIDALLQLAVVSVNSNTPPGSPAEGARYIVGPSPTGAWAGRAGKLARFLNTAWTFFDARYALNLTDALWYVRQSTTWSALSTGFTGGTLTTALNEGVPATLASAATLNIGAANRNTIFVTGAATITAFDSIAAGAKRMLIFGGASTLTHNGTSLILPTGANIIPALGDIAEFLSLGSGNWECVGYLRASGQALDASGFANGDLTFTAGRKIRSPLGAGMAIAFESSSDNENCSLTVQPRGTAVSSGFLAKNSSDATNFARMRFYIDTSALVFAQSVAGSGAYVPMVFQTGGSASLTIATDGKISAPGVYATTTASAANVVVDSAGLLQRSTSSEQYKRDIEPMLLEYAEKAYDLTPIWYRSACSGDNADWSWWGFSAEQATLVDPRLVQWRQTEPVEVDGEPDSDGNPTKVIEHRQLAEPVAEGFAYERLVVHHNALLKQQRDKIKSLEERLAILEALVTPA